jgi:hypothetical protein
MTPRILTIDIETSPIEAYVWQLFDQNVAINQIKTEWSILSYAAKWFGEKKMIYDDTGGRGAGKVRDDKKLMQGLWDLFDEADIVVGQNHKKFDIRKINARLIEHGFGPYSPFKAVDTSLEARRVAAFTSKKLEWMSAHLTNTPKDTHKEFPGFELWTECLKDNPRAWEQMKKYNCRDVVATEKVYKKLRPWIKSHPNVGVFVQDKERRCTKCGSKNLQRRGYALTMQTSYPRYQCQECGGWVRGTHSELDPQVRKALLANAL